MKVKVEMKDGELYRGIKGGVESGFLNLFRPEKLRKDVQRGEEIEWSQAMGNEETVLMLPVGDIKLIISQ